MLSIPSPRTIVVRGDLYSDTGYARATRALCGLLRGLTKTLYVISLHAHDRRRHNDLPYATIGDAELVGSPHFRDAVIINLCLPNAFLRVNGAINVGYFFWETTALPRAAFWKADLLRMDRLWAPSMWQSAYLRSVTGQDAIPVVPWPLEAQAPVSGLALSDRPIHVPMNLGPLDRWRAAATNRDSLVGRLADIDDGDLFLAVQTDAPRKGLPMLVSNWMAFKRSPEGRRARLLIKLSSIDVNKDQQRLQAQASDVVRQASERFDVTQPDIWFLFDRLSAQEMRQLLTRADALVSTTMGEGFGGPIAEALLEATPVIVPRHTAIRDLIDEDYPLAVASTAFHLALRDNLDVYSPASTWHVVDDASFLDRLKTFTRMPCPARRPLAERARASLLAKAGVAVVADILSRELRSYDESLAA